MERKIWKGRDRKKDKEGKRQKERYGRREIKKKGKEGERQKEIMEEKR